MVWIDFYGSLYIHTDNFKNFHPFPPFLGPVDLHFGLKNGQKSTIYTKMAAEGRWFGLEIVWIDFYGSCYNPTDNFKNFHPFSPFPGHKRFISGTKRAITGQKSFNFRFSPLKNADNPVSLINFRRIGYYKRCSTYNKHILLVMSLWRV